MYLEQETAQIWIRPILPTLYFYRTILSILYFHQPILQPYISIGQYYQPNLNFEQLSTIRESFDCLNGLLWSEQLFSVASLA